MPTPDSTPSSSSSTDSPQSASTPPRGSLLVIFLTVVIDLLGFALVLPLLPLYARQYSVDETGITIGLLMASFSIMQFLFAPLWGKLSDRIGRRPVLIVGLLGSVVCYSLFGVATLIQSLPLLFLTRIGAGIAGATISTAQAYIADVTTVENRSKGMALIGMAFGIGFTFGPLVGLLAVPNGEGIPGPWPGFVAALLSTVALILACFLLPESLATRGEKQTRKLLDLSGFRTAIAIPSIGMVLLAIFVCVFSFGNFETTLSLLIEEGKGEHITYETETTSTAETPQSASASDGPFAFSWAGVCLTYAYIGFTLTLVQGVVVRRLAGKVPEGIASAIGAGLQILGFTLMILAITQASVGLLLAALFFVVAGFSIMQPNLNAMLSRRSDPARQGLILGVGQSVSSMARILGPMVGIPLYYRLNHLPYCVAAALMLIGLLLVLGAAARGKDYAADQA
ncbi:MAG TPA: MFS transporter [Planctomycetaceae bacterium]|nr:MFS transporter [Blastopirellula sp.]HAY82815.1 MFS transporter [Planctomycetaceae bacterium]